MITAVIIAGGRGVRMGQDIPKQFILLDGKPVIIYTLEVFEKHPLVDNIVCVCIDVGRTPINLRREKRHNQA